MDGKGTREIVIEIEQVRLVRKRALTTLRYCEECESQSDFVGLEEAARLFEVDPKQLVEFILRNNCHFIRSEVRVTDICLTALIDRMRVMGSRKVLSEKSSHISGEKSSEDTVQ